MKQSKICFLFRRKGIQVNRIYALVIAGLMAFGGAASAFAEANDGRTGSVYSEQQQSTINVSGTVTDTNGDPIPGASVVVKGTSTGTITDMEGRYSIEVPENGTLVFSFVGFNKVEADVEGQRNLDITMSESVQDIDEVVVTALGIEKESKALGYSVSSVGEDRIMASGEPSNALQSLYGSAAGVQVAQTASGASGGMKINIRNAVSFSSNSSTRPLFVVDGIPIHDENTGMGYDATNRDTGTGINDINSSDIESIEILKGAKASVLYGNEGANGVVLITTKSGAKTDGLGISASFTKSWDRVAFMPELQDQYGTGRSPSNTETDAQGFFLDENEERTLDYSGQAFGPKFDPNVSLNWWDGSQRAWMPQTDDIYDDMFRDGQQTTSNISLSSGNEDGSVRVSLTNMQLTPTLPSGFYEKNSFSLSAQYNFNDYISVRYSGNFYVTSNKNAANANTLDSQGARTSLGAYSSDINVDLIRDKLVTPEGYNYFASPSLTDFFSAGRSAIANFFWDQGQNLSMYNRHHNIQSLDLNFTFNETFSATLKGGMDNTSDRDEYKGRLMDPSLIGPNSGSSYTDKSRDIRKTYGEGLLNFNTNVSDFNFSGFIGGSVRHNYSEMKGARRIGGMVIPNFFSYANLPSGEQPQYNFNNAEDIRYSLLGSGQIAWKDQVYVEAQGRQDWSSILPPSNNSYFFPGVSATWLMHESLELPYWVDFAKVRGSWADVGRPGPRYFSNVNYGISASGGGYILVPPSFLPPMDEDGVPNLKPERKREFEVGFESYLFANQRIGVDFSYYTSNTYNQIMGVTAPPGMGVDEIRMNAGDVATNGWELALKTKPILTNDFQWGLDFMFSGSKTKVEELDGELSTLTLWSQSGLNAVAEVGGEYGLIYQQRGWQHYIDPSDPDNPKNGERIVKDDGTMYAYSTESNKMVGKLLPDVTGGVYSSFKYKNFSLIANIDYSFGSTSIKENETYMMAAGVLDETLEYRDAENGGIAYYLQDGQKVAGEAPGGGDTYYDGVMLDGVYADGTENDKVVSAQDYYDNSYFANGFFPEDRLFKDDYVALRNLALDYTVPRRISEMGMLKELTLSVFSNNVAYLYRAAPNSIPESSDGTGWDSSSYGTSALPSQRSFGFSVKVKL